MSVAIIHSGTHKARKSYSDDGSENVMEWKSSGYHGAKDGDDVRLELFLKEHLPYVIKKGDTYVRQFNQYDGDAYVWRTKELFYYLICKYDLFDEL